jgi:uncharacterized phage protein gp47/JayE
MAFNRPSLIALRDAAYADIERIPGADARLAFGNLNVLAHILAGGVDGLYGYLEWLSRQVLTDTAEEEYLDRHASIWKVPRRSAVAASGLCAVSGTFGTVVPAGTLFVRSDGQQFTSTDEISLSGTTADLGIAATTPGVSTNAAAGTNLTLVSPVAGLSPQAVVGVDGLVNGSDLENDDSLRARILQRIQNPPSGGAASDYEQWALEVPGVSRVWVFPAELGAGTVTLRFVRDGDASPIPDAGEVAVVQDYIDGLRPVTAELYVVAPVPSPIDFEIALTPDTTGARAAVEAELRDLILREGAPGQTMLISHIREAISIALGEIDHVLTAPTANVAHLVSEIATFGSITWT